MPHPGELFHCRCFQGTEQLCDVQRTVSDSTRACHTRTNFHHKLYSTREHIFLDIVVTAGPWFNGTTSSAAERAELPDELAKKLVKELSKLRGT